MAQPVDGDTHTLIYVAHALFGVNDEEHVHKKAAVLRERKKSWARQEAARHFSPFFGTVL